MVGLGCNGSTIVIGMPMEEDQSKELVSWTLSILAHPNDTLVALHVLEGEEPKKVPLRDQRAKASIISLLADFAKICQSREVYLEARVRYSSSIGKGLIKEAKTASAEFVVLGGTCKMQHGVANYCFRHAPKGCSIFTIGTWSPNTHQAVFPEKTSSPRSSSSSPPPLPLALKKHNRKRIVSSLLRRLPFSFREKGHSDDDRRSSSRRQPALRCFSYQELSRATNEFHSDNVVGRGGFSQVYRGEYCQVSIAVKRVAKDNANPRKETDFLMELGVIGHVSHPNTATLLGYCVEKGLYLVFNYSANGTLSNALHASTDSVLEWPLRYKISLGIARGLHYLHNCCKHKIIHRDITASNVLLASDYHPQITDFGLAKWLPSNGLNHAVAPIIQGTFGYLAPEYFMHGMVDEKTDVYAFGVVLLETITGRMPVNHLTKDNLLLWATPIIESGNIQDLVDPRLQGRYQVDQLHTLVLAASHCVQQSSSLRPSITQVLEILEEDSYGGSTRSMPKISTEEVNDYSMAFGYNFPIDFSLDEEEDC